MDDHGIKPEWKEAWQQLDESHWEPDDWEGYRYCTDLAVHLLAKLIESEFWREHELYTCQSKTEQGEQACTECGTKNFDPRHLYKYDDWCREAREKLGNG